MRTSHTFPSRIRGTRKLIGSLIVPLVLTTVLLSTRSASQAEDPPAEDMVIALEIFDFSGFVDPLENGTEVYGQINAPNVEGVTVTFTGCVTGTAVTDSGGYFYHYVAGYNTGKVTASVSQGGESDSKDLNL